MESPPSADEPGGQQEHHEHAHEQTAGKAKPDISAVDKRHPGPRVSRRNILDRDRKWIDIGSGMMSRTFVGATRLHTTSKGGPSLHDIEVRKVWSLTTGKLLDECRIDDVADHILHRNLEKPDDIRVEVILKNAIELYEKKGPDVVEIFSQPRVCQEAASGRYLGERLRPGWSLDLTMNDPKTGAPWDLGRPEVQSRVKKLIKSTQPFCVIGSPPCTPFSRPSDFLPRMQCAACASSHGDPPFE